MKILLIPLALSCFVAISALSSVELEREERLHDIFGDLVNKTINNIINNITDPIIIKDISLQFNQEGTLEGGVNATNIYLIGIKSLVASYIKVNLLPTTLSMIIEIPKLSLKFDYWIDALLLDIVPLYGSGSNDIDISGVTLNITANADITKGIKVSNVGVILTLDSATFNLNGLLNNPEFSALINTALNDNFAHFVNENNQLLSSFLGSLIESIINGATGLEYEQILPQ